MRSWSARRWAALAAVVLGAGLIAIIVATTPWQTLPPVPGGSAAVDAGRDFSAAEIARQDAYHAAIGPPAYASLAVTFGLVLLLGVTPLGAGLIARVGDPTGQGIEEPDRRVRVSRPLRFIRWARPIVLGGFVLALLGRLVALPFDIRAEVVMRRYDLSTQDWASWTSDQLKSFGIGAALTALVLLALLALVRRSAHWWWVPGSALAALLVAVGSFVYPVVIEPVFNKFTPMEPGPLKSSLLALAKEDGLPVKDVLVADASRRTNKLNAYVSGYGSTRRIVVYDTTLREMTPEEIRLITAHELGHVKNNDVLHGTLIGGLAIAFGVCVLYLAVTMPWLQRRAGIARSAGEPSGPGPPPAEPVTAGRRPAARPTAAATARALADPRSIAVILAVLAVLTQVSNPVQLLISRRIEARADVHALNLVRDPAGQIAMQHRLAVANLSNLDPNQIVYGLFASHPTPPERTALARDWAKINHEPVP